MADPIGEIPVRIIGDFSDLLKALQDAEKASQEAADKFGQSWAKVGSQLEGLGSSLSGIGTSLTAAITTPLVGVSTAALMVSGSLEQASVAFKTMMGSAIQAQNHLDELKAFALSTPFEFTDLVKASQRLQALGFAAEEVIPMLTAVGNAAAGLSSGAEGIQKITLALGQMQSKNRVMTQEMNQLTEAGIKAWDILAEHLSKVEKRTVTVAEVMKRTEQGLIAGGMAVQVLLEGMNKRYKDLMAEQAKTVPGMFSNLVDQAKFVLKDIGDALAPIAKQIIGQLSEVLKKIQEWIAEFKKLPPGVQQAAIAFAALAAAAGPVLLIVGQLTTAVGSIISLWTTLGLSMGAVAAVAVPVVAALAVIAASIAAIHFTGLDKEIMHFISTVRDNFSGIVDLFQDVIDAVKQLVKDLGELTGIRFKDLTISWQGFFEVVAPQFVMLREAIKLIIPFIEKMGGSYKSMADAAKLQLANLQAVHDETTRKAAEAAMGEIDNNKKRKKSLEDLTAAAEAYAKKLKEAFSTLGVVDVEGELKEAQAAYALLAKSGKLSVEQLATAHENLNKKLYAFLDAEYLAAQAVENLAREFEKMSTKADTLKGIAFVKSMFPPEWFKEQKDALALLEKLREEMDRFWAGQKVKAGMKLLPFDVKEFTDLGKAIESLGDESVEKLSIRVKESAKAYDDLAKNVGKLGIVQRDLDLSLEESLKDQIKLKAVLGQDATKEIRRLDDLIRKTKELTDASQRLGRMYAQIREEFDKLFDARQLLETLGGALFDTSENDKLRESIKGLNQDLADAAIKWGDVQREAAAALEEIVADHAKAQQRIREDAARSFRDATIDYRRFVEDAREDLAKAQREGDAEQVREIQKQLRRRAEDYAIYVSDLKKATAQKLQDDQEAQAKETKAVQDNLAQQKVAYDQFVAATTAKIVEMTDAMTNAFERMGNAFKDMLKGFVTEVGKLVASTILQGYLDSLKKKITSALFPDLDEGGVPGGGLLSKIIGKGGSTASPVNVPGGMPPGGDVDLSSIGGSNSGIAAQGIGSTIGTALGTGGDVAAIATAAMTAYMLVVLKRIEKDIARMEVTTRGMLNQLISLQGTFNTYLPQIADRALGIWTELINVVEILRIMGQSGFGGGGKDIGQQIADSINSRPHVTTDGSGMQDILNVQNQSIDAANEYNLALQTTASTAYELDDAVSGTTDGLYYLNEAVTGLAGALPGFTDEMDRAVFNSMAGQQAGQNLSPGGPRSNMTPFIMPVPVPDALTGPGGFMQAAMLPHENRVNQFPTIAPVVGGPGVTRGSTALVYVTAVDPTSRSVTKGIVTGLEEVGIRVR